MTIMWHYDQPQDGILWVRIECEGRPVNALSQGALEELEQLVRRVRDDSSLTGVIFRSGKPGNFIAGADVTEFKDMQGVDAARQISEFGQKVFQQVEDLRVPAVALISGACLGGGLEFAMACRYRIADEHGKTLLGLPEVKLGLIPGWGGTVRLPKLIGLLEALPMILTGKMLNGRQSRSKGLVHDVVPTEALRDVGEKIISTCVQRGSADSLFRSKKKPLWLRMLQGSRIVHKIALGKAEKQVLANTRGHYPAPEKVIDVLRANLGRTGPEAFAIESKAVASLADHPVTTECIRLFFLQEDAKKPPASITVKPEPETLRQAAVIGAGAMGAGIALMLAKKGVFTRLKDIKPDFVANGLKTVRGIIGKDVKRRRMSRLDATRAMDHLSPTTDYRGLKHADIVIEAIIEDVEIKRQVFRELAEATEPETVLATNTSSLLVSEIARDVPHPERVVGLHFFNPPHKMMLVEVVRTPQSSPEAVATAWATVQRLGKTGVLVGDCAGFLVNRLLAPYMNEAGHLLAEVSDPMEIERAAIEFGMPMGPLELTDLVGIGVAAHVSRNMHAAYGDRMQPAPLWTALEEMRSEQKSGATRLIDKKGSHKSINPEFAKAVAELRRGKSTSTPLDRQTIIQRLVYPVINEAARCIDEGIVEKPEDVDLAMVFGTGFAPFRGGPLRYADSIGLPKIVETLDRFAAEHSRMEPVPLLRRMADSGATILEPIRQEEIERVKAIA